MISEGQRQAKLAPHEWSLSFLDKREELYGSGDEEGMYSPEQIATVV
jgi:hypothetical protein